MNLPELRKIEDLVLNKYTGKEILVDVLEEEYKFLHKFKKQFLGISLFLIDSERKFLDEVYTTNLRKSVKTINSDTSKISLKISQLKNTPIYTILFEKEFTKSDGIPFDTKHIGNIDEKFFGDVKVTYIYRVKYLGKPVGILCFYASKPRISKDTLEVLEFLSQIVMISLQKIRYESEIDRLKSKVNYLEKHKEDADKRKDDFISVVSHELKTPISIAKNNLWMFKNKYGTQITNEELQYLKSLEHGLYRMQKIVDNMLDLSRIQDNRLELEIGEFDLYDLTLQSARSFREQADKKGLDLIYPKKIVAPIETDGTRLQEVIENLISNAIKYTEKGSVGIMIDDLGQFYKVSVVDTGPGISDHDKVKIFTKFGQASEGLKLSKSGESTGLGLYVAKNFIEQMGGDIGFESELGKGSTFWIKVPKKYNGKRKDVSAQKSKAFFIFSPGVSSG